MALELHCCSDKIPIAENKYQRMCYLKPLFYFAAYYLQYFPLRILSWEQMVAEFFKYLTLIPKILFLSR